MLRTPSRAVTAAPGAVVCFLLLLASCASKAERAAEHFGRGLAYAEEWRFAEAIACYDSALALNPTYEDALVRKGDALASTMRIAAALETYDRALGINDRSVAAHVGRACVLTRLESPVEARKAFDRAFGLTEHPDSVLVLKGWAEYAADRGDDARESFRLAVDANPQNKSAWLAIALVSLNARTINRAMAAQDALEALDRALGIDPNDELALTLKAGALRQTERIEEELATYDRLLAVLPSDSARWHVVGNRIPVLVGRATTLYSRAAALHKLGRFDECLASLDSSLSIEPMNYDAWLLKGRALNGMGRLDEARAAWLEAERVEAQAEGRGDG